LQNKESAQRSYIAADSKKPCQLNSDIKNIVVANPLAELETSIKL